MENNWEQCYASLKQIKKKDSEVSHEIYELLRQQHFLGSKFYKPLLRETARSAKYSLDLPSLEEHGIGGIEQLLDIDYQYCKEVTQHNEKKCGISADRSDNGQGGKYNVPAENIANSIIIQGVNTGNISIGDVASRQEDARVKINFEIKGNLSELATSIQAIESLKPEPFWDKRKVNETEQNYQTRAEGAFLKYKELITSEISKNKYSRNVYLSFINQIVDKNVLEKLENIYSHFEEVIYYMHSYDDYLNHLLSLGIGDKRRSTDCLSRHSEILTSLKIHLLESAAYYFTAFNDYADGNEILLSLSIANIHIDIAAGQKPFSQCHKKIAEYAAEKTEILRERIVTDKKTRHIDPDIHDPYIVMLRKTVGLCEALSESEIRWLENSDIDMEETDPLKLFKLAAFSYIELDGEASIIYFERILTLSDIPLIHRMFAENSLHRLKNPEFYQGALGIMVLGVNNYGGLERAGVQAGDVIITINGQPLLEPFDLSAVLASEKAGTPVLLKLVRNKSYSTIILNSGEPAGAVLSQLVIYNLFQL